MSLTSGLNKLQRYWQEIFFCFQIGADFSSRLSLALATIQFHGANGFKQSLQKNALPEKPRRYHLSLDGTVFDLWLRTYSGDIFIFYEVFMDRVYSLPVQSQHPVNSIVDLGAHIGLTTLFFAQQYPQAKFVCVEPDPANARILRQNVACLQERVQVLEVAVSHQSGYASLVQIGWSWGGYLNYDRDVGTQVSCKTVDEIMVATATTSIDILKIDIEGEEKQLFAQPGHWLEVVKLAVIELHGPYSADDMQAAVLPLGIQVMRPTPEYSNRLTLLLSSGWHKSASTTRPQPLTCVFIACAGHSGSTLLETLLANHANIFGLGEFNHFAEYFDDPYQRCGCGEILSDCPFWNQVVQQANGSNSLPLRKLMPTERLRPRILSNAYGAVLLLTPFLFKVWANIPGSLAQKNVKILGNYWRLISLASRLSNSSVVIDKSMSPSHVLELFSTRPAGVRFKVIHLVRDGRANMLSYMRSLEVSAQDAAINWKRMNRHIRWIGSHLPSEDVYQVRYEDLCRDPQKTITELCNFIGVEYQPSMLVLRSKRQHGIAGNAMRLRDDKEIRLDERWTTQLSASDLTAFEKVAGLLNKSFGYH